MNLFVSFILRAISVFIKDGVLYAEQDGNHCFISTVSQTDTKSFSFTFLQHEITKSRGAGSSLWSIMSWGVVRGKGIWCLTSLPAHSQNGCFVSWCHQTPLEQTRSFYFLTLPWLFLPSPDLLSDRRDESRHEQFPSSEGSGFPPEPPLLWMPGRVTCKQGDHSDTEDAPDGHILRKSSAFPTSLSLKYVVPCRALFHWCI